MSGRFKIMSVTEFLAQPSPRGGRQAPKEAFREGFVHALNAVRDLRRGGFTRPDEIASILELYAAGELKAWAAQPGGAYNSQAPKVWTRGEWYAIRRVVFKRDGRRCACCGSTKKLQIDHVHPVTQGGLPVLENLQVLCKNCNLQKGAG